MLHRPQQPAHFAAASITSPQRKKDCQRPKTTKNDRILSNFTKNRR
jgi:hypothetical protein